MYLFVPKELPLQRTDLLVGKSIGQDFLIFDVAASADEHIGVSLDKLAKDDVLIFYSTTEPYIIASLEWDSETRHLLENSGLLDPYSKKDCLINRVLKEVNIHFHSNNPRSDALKFNETSSKSMIIKQLSFKWQIIKQLNLNLSPRKLKRLVLFNLVDTFAGLSLAFLFHRNSSIILHSLSFFYKEFFNNYLQIALNWLMHYPAGLKLNSELSEFIGLLFIWLSIVFQSILDAIILNFKEIIVDSSTLVVCMGASFFTCLALDMFRLFTLHLESFFMVSFKFFSWETTIIKSLVRLFAGKRFNVLRQRTDSYTYTLDQLLVGTIFFSCLIFLFPTFAAYYLLFWLIGYCKRMLIGLNLELLQLLNSILTDSFQKDPGI